MGGFFGGLTTGALKSVAVLTVATHAVDGGIYTVPTGTSVIYVTGIGGGGGSGSSTCGINTAACTGGGGSGAWASSIIVRPDAFYYYTIGAKGAGGVGKGVNGGTGGSTTFYSTLRTLIDVGGGTGSIASDYSAVELSVIAFNSAGRPGAVNSIGNNQSCPGRYGNNGISGPQQGATPLISGAKAGTGANSNWGSGGQHSNLIATGYGSGGGGSLSDAVLASGTVNGNAGTDGCIIIYGYN